MEAVQAKQLQLRAFLIRNLSLAEVRWINIINCKRKILISSPRILSQEIEKNKTKLKIFVSSLKSDKTTKYRTKSTQQRLNLTLY